MHILMTGAAGMIGRKLTARLVKDGKLNGKPIDRLTLIDVVPPERPQGFSGTVEATTSDLSAPGAAAKAVDGKPDVSVFPPNRLKLIKHCKVLVLLGGY